ncbi:hypothetical protein BU14_0869s0003 [Porphyra umbilicalis]|uniref:C2H2-type domain-containing protein n=1 Tax=Porphyra umbilicalis TaxID=2786 RepID=A0A1X6NPB3_PORUM|nr:hypothetical protein BU14_0869s0003 [Porphyra umbilicalis]|eukprot:OSX70183.1 hypothetical protein BU14_0869s0003 [Porphyra umbilicalis]
MGGRPRTAGVGGVAAGTGAAGGVQKPAGIVYNCAQPGCTKTFTRRSNLRAHARIHSGLEPYVCLEAGCFKRFKWKSCLNSHQRTHLRRQSVAMAACQKADKSWVVYDGTTAAATVAALAPSAYGPPARGCRAASAAAGGPSAAASAGRATAVGAAGGTAARAVGGP